VSEHERRHDRVVEEAQERDELGDQVDGEGDPRRREHHQDLGAAGAPRISNQAAEQQDQVRKERRQLLRRGALAEDGEGNDTAQPHAGHEDQGDDGAGNHGSAGRPHRGERG
jgi:hypothetical protein